MSEFEPLTPADLPAAARAARPRDVVTLRPDVRWVRSGARNEPELPSYTGPDKILYRSKGYEPGQGKWPAHHTRLKEDAPTLGHMATVCVEGHGDHGSGPFEGPFGPGYYEFQGLHLTAKNDANERLSYCFNAGNFQAKELDQLPRIDYRHCVIDGRNAAHATTLNTLRTSLRDSIIYANEDMNTETHAIWGNTGHGPMEVINCLLSGGCISLLIGSYITLMRDGRLLFNCGDSNKIWFNHIKRSRNAVTVKAAIEIAGGFFWWLRGNIIEDVWNSSDAGQGRALNFSIAKELGGSGGFYDRVADKLLVEDNILRNVKGLVRLLGHPQLPWTNARMVNNFALCGVDPRTGNDGFTVMPDTFSVFNAPGAVFDHQTIFGNASDRRLRGTLLVTGDGAGESPDLQFLNTIAAQSSYGQLARNSHGNGLRSLEHACGPGRYRWAGNMVVPGVQDHAPDYDEARARNYILDSQAALEALLTAEYRLHNPANYLGTDGLAVGVDWERLLRMTDGVIEGKPRMLQEAPETPTVAAGYEILQKPNGRYLVRMRGMDGALITDGSEDTYSTSYSAVNAALRWREKCLVKGPIRVYNPNGTLKKTL